MREGERLEAIAAMTSIPPPSDTGGIYTRYLISSRRNCTARHGTALHLLLSTRLHRGYLMG